MFRMMMELKQFIMAKLSPTLTMETIMTNFDKTANTESFFYSNQRQRFYYCSSTENFGQIHSIIIPSYRQYCHSVRITNTEKHKKIHKNLIINGNCLDNNSSSHYNHWSFIIIFVAIIFMFAEIVSSMATLSTKSMTMETSTIPFSMETSSLATISTLSSKSSSIKQFLKLAVYELEHFNNKTFHALTFGDLYDNLQCLK
ncbi:hypothetical protein DERF_011276 [Dermatophagoides farinae]|uniref:Uncharacterized protein n=1 Tax=Dermatophagoides farinae TaxID=6954 RepID=A0A922HSQ5_DERFA|nr:hypothetical protein DERF_011276 [Dermatophagoides farinae]